MKTQPKYYLVDSRALPEIFTKVMKCKNCLQSGAVKTVNEAAMRYGISRSTYYKYKDMILPFYSISSERIITLSVILRDEPGNLSELLNVLAKGEANVLTINQNIPSNGIANITVSVQTADMKTDIERILTRARKLRGVLKIEVVSL